MKKKNSILITELEKLIAEGEKAIKVITSRNEYFRKTLELASDDSISGLAEHTPSDLLTTLTARSQHPDYPYSGKLLEKLQYMEDMNLKLWNTDEGKEFILKVEGPKAAKTIKDMSQKLNYYVKKGEVFAVKINGSKHYTFYSTRREWIQNIRTVKGKKVADIVPGHEPAQKHFKNLSDEQKSPDNMVWSGI